MDKKIIFIDLDDTIADFLGSEVFKDRIDIYKMFEPGFFFNLKPVDGALSGVRALIEMGWDVYILTQPVAESAHSYSEKVQWIGMWFPELIRKVNMVQDKGLVKGDFLIDDNEKKWKERFESNGGKFVHFRYNKDDREGNARHWRAIVGYFRRLKVYHGRNE